MLQRIKYLLKTHKDLIVFMLVVVIIHSVWKLGREEMNNGETIFFYGKDFSSFFNYCAEWWAQLIYKITYAIKGDVVSINRFNIHFSDTNTGVRIIWGCIGIKELIMTFTAILLAKGPWIDKLWYIPASLIAMTILILIRLLAITLVMHHHPDMFDFLHSYVFRVSIYIGMFLLWVIWTDKIAKNAKESSSKITNN